MRYNTSVTVTAPIRIKIYFSVCINNLGFGYYIDDWEVIPNIENLKDSALKKHFPKVYEEKKRMIQRYSVDQK